MWSPLGNGNIVSESDVAVDSGEAGHVAQPSLMSPLPIVRCREIAPGDLEGILLLLQQGFPERSRDWLAPPKLARIVMHDTPPGYS